MRAPREPSSGDGYARPQQAWQCGLSDEGPACPLGPTGWGRCPAAAECHPSRDGDRWTCNRSPLRGGPCDGGPGPDGACAVVHRCTPLRSLRARRGRFVVGCLVAAVGAAAMAFGGAWRNELVAPGPLSVHHAHLVGGAGAGMRCAQCHGAANASLAGGVGLSESSGGSAVASQSSLCTACHEKTVTREWATAGHNLPLEVLRAGLVGTEGAGGETPRLAWGGPRRDAAAAIACAACHQEHQGREHDLTAIADAACQACHRERFESFAEGHPDFGLWPYVRRTRIRFDHASHQLKHHPTEKREFACADCHRSDSTGTRELTLNYAAACGACHDKGIAVSLADGVPLVSLPTLDVEAMTDAGVDMAPWPEDAAGDFDGRLPAAARLLLAAKPQAAAALGELGPAADFYDVDPDDAKQLVAAGVVAQEVRALVDEVATRGQPAITDRLAAVLGRELSPAEVEALAGRLSPDVAAAYRDRWFGASSAAAAGDRAAQLARVPGGGWVRDDGTLSLRYKATGHADPLLRAWLDVLAKAATGAHAAIAEPLLRAELAPTAPGQCGSCHSVERDARGKLAIQWRPFEPHDEPASLTRFAHGPHVLQPQLADCAACHQIATTASASAGYTTDNPRQFTAGFEPMTKSSCVTCHTAAAAGSACTQCHRYHGGGSPLSVVRGSFHEDGRFSHATDNGPLTTDSN